MTQSPAGKMMDNSAHAPYTDRPGVLMTGASRGIGRTCALELARRDWPVVGTSRNPQHRERGKGIIVIIGSQGGRIPLPFSQSENWTRSWTTLYL